MLVAWARAETALIKTYVTATKLHFNEAASLYYAIPTFDSRVKALLSVMNEVHNHQPIPGIDEIKDAVSSLSVLSKTRNEWVHAVWVIPEGLTVAHTINMKKPPETRRAKPVAVGSIRSHNEAVRTQSRALERHSSVHIALKS